MFVVSKRQGDNLKLPIGKHKSLEMKKKFLSFWNWLTGKKQKNVVSDLVMIIPLNYGEFIVKYPDLFKEHYTYSSGVDPYSLRGEPAGSTVIINKSKI